MARPFPRYVCTGVVYCPFELLILAEACAVEEVSKSHIWGPVALYRVATLFRCEDYEPLKISFVIAILQQ